jgi:upstream activation factor subunit UAF30
MAAKKKTAKKAKPAKRSASKKAKRPAARKTATKARKGGAKKAAKKAAKRPAAKKAAKKPAPKAAKKKRTPNAAFMKPMTPSGQLAAVVGEKAIPRSEVTKKVWAYIKSKGLQDNKNRRMINADDKLGPVFGGKKQVSMFEMTKLVNKHLK